MSARRPLDLQPMNFKVSARVRARMLRLVETLDATTQVEVLKKALSLLELAAEAELAGGYLVVVQRDGTDQKILVL